MQKKNEKVIKKQNENSLSPQYVHPLDSLTDIINKNINANIIKQ